MVQNRKEKDEKMEIKSVETIAKELETLGKPFILIVASSKDMTAEKLQYNVQSNIKITGIINNILAEVLNNMMAPITRQNPKK